MRSTADSLGGTGVDLLSLSWLALLGAYARPTFPPDLGRHRGTEDYPIGGKLEDVDWALEQARERLRLIAREFEEGAG
jgi:hypothetical protein